MSQRIVVLGVRANAVTVLLAALCAGMTGFPIIGGYSLPRGCCLRFVFYVYGEFRPAFQLGTQQPLSAPLVTALCCDHASA